jgi:hypothetical protein
MREVKRHTHEMLWVLVLLLGTLIGLAGEGAMQSHTTAMNRDLMERGHVGPFAWSNQQWQRRCAGVRTCYNPDHDLHSDALTLHPSDPRWLDFVFWSLNNKVNEHQFEAYGGTGWNGPTGGG